MKSELHTKHTCAEISYMNSENIPVSSDLCVIGEMTDEYKEFLKANFAEFLDNFRHDPGTYFYIG